MGGEDDPLPTSTGTAGDVLAPGGPTRGDVELGGAGSPRAARGGAAKAAGAGGVRRALDRLAARGGVAPPVAGAVAFQLCCSVTMMLANKGAVRALPFPTGLLVLQCGATSAGIAAGRALRLAGMRFEPLSWEKGRRWVGVVVCWVLPMLFSMKALEYTNIETVVVFRQLSTILVAGGDYAFNGKAFHRQALVAIGVGLVGSVVYAGRSEDYTFVGYFWCAMYAASMFANALYVKKVFDSLPQMGPWEKTYYQNTMGIPVLAAIMLVTEDLSDFFAALFAASAGGLAVVLLSCAVGLCQSLAGTISRDLLSPTSFNILGNASKPLTILIGAYLFQTHNSWQAVLGLVLVLVSGAMYSLAPQAAR